MVLVNQYIKVIILLFYIGGAKYKGEWKDNKKHGKGNNNLIISRYLPF